MPEVESCPQKDEYSPSFRLDVRLHDLLTKPEPRREITFLPSSGPPQLLPEPVFPLGRELLGEDGINLKAHQAVVFGQRRRWSTPFVLRGVRGWLFPYVRFRLLPGSFHAIFAYLFTGWKCNLDCRYRWALDNRVKGMAEEAARRSIDWLMEKDRTD